MWTPTTCAQHRRDHLRYASDLTDAEWAVREPLFPAARATGRPPTPLRRVLEAIFYVLRGGIPWRMLPEAFPPYQTVFGRFATWRDDGTSAFHEAKSPGEAINHHLVICCANTEVILDRERAGREASPAAATIDS